MTFSPSSGLSGVFPEGSQVVCGQAISPVADTASVLTLSSANGRFRNCTTIDLSTQFMRPVMRGDVNIDIKILSNGHGMAVTRANFFASGSEKITAAVAYTFAYLEE